ncbi:MAG: hypothetical protein PF569_08995 [Candidatus Woesearchaeota archaeon]|jgi:hypothetical protein|nr:hypothetical protein [Candidatus Woesearchaeota archaeon]
MEFKKIIQNININNPESKLRDAKLLISFILGIVSLTLFLGLLVPYIPLILLGLFAILSIIMIIKENIIFYSINYIFMTIIFLLISYTILFELEIGLLPPISVANIITFLIYLSIAGPFIYYGTIGEIILIKKRLE